MKGIYLFHLIRITGAALKKLISKSVLWDTKTIRLWNLFAMLISHGVKIVLVI